MAKVYKVRIGKKLSDKTFTFRRCEQEVKKLKKKGKNAEVYLFKDNVRILDFDNDGEVEYFV